jgi:hypothetical protein
MSIRRRTADERQNHQKRKGDLAAARKEGRTGHEEAEKERKRGPHTWRKTIPKSER